jgi:hypothetical protein
MGAGLSISLHFPDRQSSNSHHESTSPMTSGSLIETLRERSETIGGDAAGTSKGSSSVLIVASEGGLLMIYGPICRIATVPPS